MREDSPFAPGFGSPPPFLAGRTELTHDTLGRLRRGPSHEFHTIVLGPRGSGKTIWIDSIAELTRSELQSSVIDWNASDRDRPLRTAVAEQAGDVERELQSRIRRGLKRLEGGVGVRAAPAGIGGEARASLSVQPPVGESSVVHTLTHLGRLAATRQRVVVLRVDELQAGSEEDLTTLGSAVQIVANSGGLPVALVAAGLPSTQQKLHDMAVGRNSSPSAGFLERQEIHEIGNLDQSATYDAFERPIEENGWTIDAAALDMLVERSNGYPYAIQLIGESTWRAAAAPGHIDVDDVERGFQESARRMERTVYRPRWRSMSNADRRYLQHAARLRNAGGVASTAAVSRAMYGNATSASRNRERLIDQHHVLEPSERGTVLFTIPGMAQWAMQQQIDTGSDDSNTSADQSAAPDDLGSPDGNWQ